MFFFLMDNRRFILMYNLTIKFEMMLHNKKLKKIKWLLDKSCIESFFCFNFVAFDALLVFLGSKMILG